MEVFIAEQGISAMTIGTDNILTAAVTEKTVQHRTLGIFPWSRDMSHTPAMGIMATGTGDFTHGY